MGSITDSDTCKLWWVSAVGGRNQWRIQGATGRNLLMKTVNLRLNLDINGSPCHRLLDINIIMVKHFTMELLWSMLDFTVAQLVCNTNETDMSRLTRRCSSVRRERVTAGGALQTYYCVCVRVLGHEHAADLSLSFEALHQYSVQHYRYLWFCPVADPGGFRDASPN